MEDAIQVIDYKGHTISIVHDPEPMNPREWDNLGIMACFHNRYTLGDSQIDEPLISPDDFNGWDEMKAYLIKEKHAAIILPLGLYDHSGITMYVGDIHDRWDGGQVGFIYVTKERLQKEYGIKRITKKYRDMAEKILRQEVKTYDQYLTGDVYGYDIEGLDSCYGFFGDEGIEDAIQQAKDAIDYHVDRENKKKQEKVKAYIEHHVPLEYRGV